MALELPGWCRSCGDPLEHGERRQGRAREFCDATCRQRHHRQAALRSALTREVGLTDPQIGRLLDLFTVVARRRS